MQLHSVLFGVPSRGDMYDRMAAALAYSASVNSPHTPLTIHHVGEDQEIKSNSKLCKATYLDNARKTKHHCRIVQDSPCGSVIGLLDADTLVLQSLSPITGVYFDIAYTVRPVGSQYPFNSGVLFVRISERTKEFYREWRGCALSLLDDMPRYYRLRSAYGGINQSSFMETLRSRDWALNLLALPCHEWNCENESFELYSENTRVLHVLGNLRRSIFGRERPRTDTITRLKELWIDYENRAATSVGRGVEAIA